MSRLAALWVISYTELRARLGRTLLTCLTLVLGILSVVGIQVISAVAEQTYVGSAELGQGRNGSAVVTPEPSTANRDMATQLVANLDHSLAVITSTGAFAIAADNTPINVVAYAGSPLGVYPYGTSEPLRPHQVVVNEAAQRLVQGQRHLRFLDGGSTSYRSITPTGVIEEGNAGSAVFIPESLLGEVSSGAVLTIAYADPSGEPAAASDRLADALSRAGLPGGDTISSVDVLTPIRAQIQVLRTAFLVAASVTLSVGILGILNIGLATLKSRVEELALRRSMGATRRDIPLIVLFDGVLVGLVGALVAVALAAAGFVPLVRYVIPTNPPAFPVSAAIVGVFAGVFAGLLGGLVPALKAGQISLASVMRA